MSFVFDEIAEELFNILRGSGYTLTLFDEMGNKTLDTSKSRRIFVQPIKMMVTIEPGRNNGVTLFLSQDSLDDELADMIQWIRKMVTRRNVLFGVKKFENDLAPKDFAFGLVKENFLESWSGTARTSFQNFRNVRIKIYHTENVDPTKRGSRTRKIKKMYLENTNGERFAFGPKNLLGARALANHLSCGGQMFDSVCQTIIDVIEQIEKLKKLKKFILFNDNIMVKTHVLAPIDNRIKFLKSWLSKLSRVRAYSDACQTVSDVQMPRATEHEVNNISELLGIMDQSICVLPAVELLKGKMMNKAIRTIEVNTPEIMEAIRNIIENELCFVTGKDYNIVENKIGFYNEDTANQLIGILEETGIGIKFNSDIMEKTRESTEQSAYSWMKSNNRTTKSEFDELVSGLRDLESGNLKVGKMDSTYNPNDPVPMINRLLSPDTGMTNDMLYLYLSTMMEKLGNNQKLSASEQYYAKKAIDLVKNSDQMNEDSVFDEMAFHPGDLVATPMGPGEVVEISDDGQYTVELSSTGQMQRFLEDDIEKVDQPNTFREMKQLEEWFGNFNPKKILSESFDDGTGDFSRDPMEREIDLYDLPEVLDRIEDQLNSGETNMVLNNAIVDLAVELQIDSDSPEDIIALIKNHVLTKNLRPEIQQTIMDHLSKYANPVEEAYGRDMMTRNKFSRQIMEEPKTATYNGTQVSIKNVSPDKSTYIIDMNGNTLVVDSAELMFSDMNSVCEKSNMAPTLESDLKHLFATGILDRIVDSGDYEGLIGKLSRMNPTNNQILGTDEFFKRTNAVLSELGYDSMLTPEGMSEDFLPGDVGDDLINDITVKPDPGQLEEDTLNELNLHKANARWKARMMKGYMDDVEARDNELRDRDPSTLKFTVVPMGDKFAVKEKITGRTIGTYDTEEEAKRAKNNASKTSRKEVVKKREIQTIDSDKKLGSELSAQFKKDSKRPPVRKYEPGYAGDSPDREKMIKLERRLDKLHKVGKTGMEFNLNTSGNHPFIYEVRSGLILSAYDNIEKAKTDFEKIKQSPGNYFAYLVKKTETKLEQLNSRAFPQDEVKENDSSSQDSDLHDLYDVEETLYEQLDTVNSLGANGLEYVAKMTERGPAIVERNTYVFLHTFETLEEAQEKLEEIKAQPEKCYDKVRGDILSKLSAIRDKIHRMGGSVEGVPNPYLTNKTENALKKSQVAEPSRDDVKENNTYTQDSDSLTATLVNDKLLRLQERLENLEEKFDRLERAGFKGLKFIVKQTNTGPAIVEMVTGVKLYDYDSIDEAEEKLEEIKNQPRIFYAELQDRIETAIDNTKDKISRLSVSERSEPDLGGHRAQLKPFKTDNGITWMAGKKELVRQEYDPHSRKYTIWHDNQPIGSFYNEPREGTVRGLLISRHLI